MAVQDITVVIGGASGIGAACARYFAANDATVVIADRNYEAAAALALELGSRAFEIDIAQEAGVRECAARVEGDVGPVKSLVNCAGLIQGPTRPLEMSMSRWDEITNVDQRGTYVTCIAFGAAMVQRRQGSIVNLASVAGMRSLPLHAYAPAKAAVISMTACLAAEWGPAGVRVNCVSPGFTRTPALQDAIDSKAFNPGSMTSGAALGRLVETVEIAKAIAFLCSSDATAITGVNLPVDCGWLAGSAWPVYGGLRVPRQL
jgi:NAD(P)-dependent dehydrogenase (short-subunit alcohol dehydrogenase family)